MSKVFVIAINRVPQMPIHPAVARRLLAAGEAAVWRTYPFTIILKQAMAPHEVSLTPLRLKLDPGSQRTGMALVNDGTGEVMWAAELTHRGQQIKDALSARRAARHSRRQRKTRYRRVRFLNRRRPEGWLPPSLQSRTTNIMTWVRRLSQSCPIGAISQELVRFDTQALQNPEIAGCDYQHGTLFGYEVKEYLLAKWHRRCAYCDIQAVPLEIEHIVPRNKGGSSRVSNLTLACVPCNQAKSNQNVRDFLAHDIMRLQRLLAQAQAPLKDATAVNTTRWKLYISLVATGLPVEVGTGGRTKFNRTQQQLPKVHWIDAACVGASTPRHLWSKTLKPLFIRATGRGSRQMCRVDKDGFPRTKAKGFKQVFGFQTGDIVKAIVPKGTRSGTYVGRVAVRANGNFVIKNTHTLVDGISHRYCHLVQNADGYAYA